MYETYIKRIIFVAQCECGERDERVDNPPKEKQCKCGRWVPFIEQSYLGPDIKGNYGRH